jgi:glycosyltransferase involved in cell wall biosynthesis
MMKTVVEGAENPSSKPVVLHLVGGDMAQGGLMSFVRAITREPLPGLEQFVWKHRDYPPDNSSTLCLSHCKTVERKLAEDIVGAARDLIPLYRWLKKQEVVIIHTHSRMGLILITVLQLLRPVPIVVSVHGQKKERGMYRLLWRMIKATLIFNSRATCHYYGFAVDKSHVLTPTIRWPDQPPPGGGRFVASGHIVRLKNVHLIIEAFLRMDREGQSLHIYGFSSSVPEPDYQDEIIRLAKPHSNISLHEWDSRWMDSLREGDIFVHAAEGEAFGIVMLEAYARGCRMVVPYGTFLEELPLSGVFQSKQEIGALAQAMAQACAFPCQNDLWRRRQSVAHLFSLENARQRLCSIYNATVYPSPGAGLGTWAQSG